MLVGAPTVFLYVSNIAEAQVLCDLYHIVIQYSYKLLFAFLAGLSFTYKITLLSDQVKLQCINNMYLE